MKNILRSCPQTFFSDILDPILDVILSLKYLALHQSYLKTKNKFGVNLGGCDKLTKKCRAKAKNAELKPYNADANYAFAKNAEL